MVERRRQPYEWHYIKEDGLPPLLDDVGADHKYSEEYLITDGNNYMVGFYREDAHSWDNYCFGWVEHDKILDKDYPFGMGEVIAWCQIPGKVYGED